MGDVGASAAGEAYTRRLMVARLVGLTVTCAFSSGLLGQTPQADPTVDALVSAAASYVTEYQRTLTAVLADEMSTQRIMSQHPLDPKMPTDRRMKSETFFMFVSPGDTWMAIRDVTEIDGKKLTERPDLTKQLASLPPAIVASTFKSYNSRYNIGRTYRNFNEPTLGLSVLSAPYFSNFDFDLKSFDRRRNGLATLSFREHGTETLLRDLLLRPVKSTGEITIEAATGRVHRSVLKATIGGLPDVKVELVTTYAADPKLGIWVPTTFRESYQSGSVIPDAKTRVSIGASDEWIIAESKYSNFRRFETSSRIK
jgi:hypothetical protein